MDTHPLLPYLLVLAVGLIFGSVTASMAKNKGYNPTIWFILGALFFLLTVIVLVVLPGNAEKIRLARHRPRRQVAPAARGGGSVPARRSSAQMPGVAVPSVPADLPPPPPPRPSPPPEHVSAGDAWQLVIGGQKAGPVSTRTLIELAVNGRITGDTLVWKEGYPEWTALRADAKLLQLIRSQTPDFA